MAALDDNTLQFPASRSLPGNALSFIGLVVRGRYRLWLLLLVSGEAGNALSGLRVSVAGLGGGGLVQFAHASSNCLAIWIISLDTEGDRSPPTPNTSRYS